MNDSLTPIPGVVIPGHYMTGVITDGREYGLGQVVEIINNETLEIICCLMVDTPLDEAFIALLHAMAEYDQPAAPLGDTNMVNVQYGADDPGGWCCQG